MESEDQKGMPSLPVIPQASAPAAEAPAVVAQPIVAQPPIPPKPPKRGIDVIATRSGFIHNERKSEGDRFTVESMDKLGSWMQCVDPVMEKKHQEAMYERNRKLRKETKESAED